ncbi:hypothetical protein [Acinetobacter modestus]|uniref:hypothetical protein n=1 Tax=Acinetobacter modestus TaxID=1776740 RepID=UPI0032098ABF
MNAINFIKQHGVDKAREVVEGAPERWTTYTTGGGLGGGYIRCSGSVGQGEVSISELKRLVESFDMVGERGGIERCKLLHFNSPFKRDNHIKRLKQAIADYEAIYSSEANDKSPLMRHLNECEEVVKTWPKWKLQSIRDAFGIPVLDNDIGDDSHIENHISPHCKVGVK